MKCFLKHFRKQGPSPCKMSNSFCSKRPLHVLLFRPSSRVKDEKYYNKILHVPSPGRPPAWSPSLALQGFGKTYICLILRPSSCNGIFCWESFVLSSFINDNPEFPAPLFPYVPCINWGPKFYRQISCPSR